MTKLYVKTEVKEDGRKERIFRDMTQEEQEAHDIRRAKEKKFIDKYSDNEYLLLEDITKIEADISVILSHLHKLEYDVDYLRAVYRKIRSSKGERVEFMGR